MKYFLLSFIFGTLLLFSITCKSFETGSEEDSTNLIDTTKSKDTTNLTDSTGTLILSNVSIKVTGFDNDWGTVKIYYEIKNIGTVLIYGYEVFCEVTFFDGTKYYNSAVVTVNLRIGEIKTKDIYFVYLQDKKVVSVKVTDIKLTY